MVRPQEHFLFSSDPLAELPLELAAPSKSKTPAVLVSGAWFAAGDATTSRPHFLLMPLAVSTTGWDTAGTALGISNALTFLGTWLDIHPSSGGSIFKIINDGGMASSGAGSFLKGVTGVIADAVTNNALVYPLVLRHRSSGTPAANFGAALLFTLDSDTTADQPAGDLTFAWSVATHATRTSFLALHLVNSGGAAAEFYRFTPTALFVGDAVNLSLGTSTGTKIGTTSSQKLSFWGATAAARPAAIAGSRSANAALADLLTKLAAIGLITDSTTA